MNPPSTSEHTPGVDYHATSERLRYEDLSPAVREAADLALGSPVVRAAAPVTSGFTKAYAGRVLLQDGRQVFLKATGPDLPIPVAALRREGQILRALGDRIPSVPLIGAVEAQDGGQVLALNWIDGHLPGFPWTDDEVALVRAACESVATVPSSVMDGLAPGRLADDLLDDDALQAALADGLALPMSLHQLPAWLPARMDEILGLARQAPTLLVGDHLNHFDLRPDNLLVGRGAGEASDRAYVLDWNWVTLGPAWCDWVGLIPTIHAQGYEFGELLASSPLSRDADLEAIDSFFAVIAVYMLRGLDHDPPSGTTSAVRHHQRYYARIFLDSLATRRRWLSRSPRAQAYTACVSPRGNGVHGPNLTR